MDKLEDIMKRVPSALQSARQASGDRVSDVADLLDKGKDWYEKNGKEDIAKYKDTFSKAMEVKDQLTRDGRSLAEEISDDDDAVYANSSANEGSNAIGSVGEADEDEATPNEIFDEGEPSQTNKAKENQENADDETDDSLDFVCLNGHGVVYFGGLLINESEQPCAYTAGSYVISFTADGTGTCVKKVLGRDKKWSGKDWRICINE